MKNLLTLSCIGVVVLSLLNGCSWQVGGGQKSSNVQPTVGQQLIDLQRAKDTGAISEGEYQAQKAKLLSR